MTETDTPETFRTDPEFSAAPWRPVPTLWDQALEAARDDPDERAFIALLASLPDCFVAAWDDDTTWASTVVTVALDGDTARYRTGDVLTIARRAGWRLADVTWERDRLEFEPRGEDNA